MLEVNAVDLPHIYILRYVQSVCTISHFYFRKNISIRASGKVGLYWTNMDEHEICLAVSSEFHQHLFE
jgi:hypothetical protein